MPNKRLHQLPKGCTVRFYGGKYEVFHGSRHLKTCTVQYDAHKWAFENAETESMWQYFVQKHKPTRINNDRSEQDIAKWHDDSARIHPASEIFRFRVPCKVEVRREKVIA